MQRRNLPLDWDTTGRGRCRAYPGSGIYLALGIKAMASRKSSKKSQGEGITALVAIAIIYFLVSTTAGHEVAIVLTVAIVALGSLFLFLKVSAVRKKMAKMRALRISDIDSMSGYVFEQYVANVLRSRGFQTQVTKGSGDSGVDVIASKGTTRYAIQCKRYAQPVPRNAVSDAVAGMAFYKCTAAMVVTNSHFTPGAKALAESNSCVLVDRDTLAGWISEWQSG